MMPASQKIILSVGVGDLKFLIDRMIFSSSQFKNNHGLARMCGFVLVPRAFVTTGSPCEYLTSAN
jgi:hypothetical protein